MNLELITAWLMTAAFVVMLVGSIFVHGNWIATEFAFAGAVFAWRLVNK